MLTAMIAEGDGNVLLEIQRQLFQRLGQDQQEQCLAQEIAQLKSSQQKEQLQETMRNLGINTLTAHGISRLGMATGMGLQSKSNKISLHNLGHAKMDSGVLICKTDELADSLFALVQSSGCEYGNSPISSVMQALKEKMSNVQLEHAELWFGVSSRHGAQSTNRRKASKWDTVRGAISMVSRRAKDLRIIEAEIKRAKLLGLQDYQTIYTTESWQHEWEQQQFDDAPQDNDKDSAKKHVIEILKRWIESHVKSATTEGSYGSTTTLHEVSVTLNSRLLKDRKFKKSNKLSSNIVVESISHVLGLPVDGTFVSTQFLLILSFLLQVLIGKLFWN
jgi:hypothetical protein